MSGPAIAVLAGLGGLHVGALLGICAVRLTRLVAGRGRYLLRQRPASPVGPSGLGMVTTPSEANHQIIADEFAVHSRAVHRAMSDYADELAGDDQVLRAHLRRFESDTPLDRGGAPW